jgi:hypothetical protein
MPISFQGAPYPSDPARLTVNNNFTLRPTSSQSGTPEATSLITRTDADNRYFLTQTNYLTTSQTAADGASFFGASAITAVPHLTFAFVPRKIIVRVIIMWTSAPVAFLPENFDVVIYNTATGTANMATGTPLTVAATAVSKVSGLEQYIITAEVSTSDLSTKYTSFFSTYGMIDLWGWQLKNKTGGSLTTVSTYAGIISLEVYN